MILVAEDPSKFQSDTTGTLNYVKRDFVEQVEYKQLFSNQQSINPPAHYIYRK